MRTLTLTEAAALLHMHPEEVRTRAKAGKLPGAKTGRRWVFIEDDLIDWMRSLYPVQRQALRVTSPRKESLCHYANADRSGGSTSSPLAGSEYDALLKPATKARRRNCTTGSRRKPGGATSFRSGPATPGTTQ
jgi:excisionase family DNA binding protein